jgi:hypothetical protein
LHSLLALEERTSLTYVHVTGFGFESDESIRQFSLCWQISVTLAVLHKSLALFSIIFLTLDV